MAAITIGALTGQFFAWASTWDRRFEGWLVAEPVRLTADLSQPGEYRADLQQTCAVAHAEVFELVTEKTIRDTVQPDLTGLRAVLTINDPKGHQVTIATFPPEFELLGPDGGDLVLFRVIPFREGKYEAVLHVLQGAESLRGRKQEVVARYELCGLERMPATVSRVAGALAALVALVLGALGVACLAPRHATSAPHSDTLGG